MKKIFSNFRTQLLLGLIIGIIGAALFYVLMFIFWIKYSGFGFLGDFGDKSPVTFAIAAFFTILTFTFPILIWFLLNRFGNLKTVSKKIRIITFILFATLPLWTYLGWGTFSKLQIAYKNYRSVRDACIIKNGVNRVTAGENTKEIECKNGVFNGFTRTYNTKGILVYEGVYLNGKREGIENVYYDSGKVKITTTYKNGEKEGTEVFYNEDGSTRLYIINDRGKSKQIYSQIPERNLDSEVDIKSQSFFCENQDKYLSGNYRYSCTNNVVNGDFIKNDPKGNLLLKVNITYGTLNGIYEQFSDGKIYRHLEFKNGNLYGKVYKYSTSGDLEYEGQYINGLQDGLFRRYDYKRSIESEVVFVNGRIVKINIP